jgi:hypothetical protein
MVWVTSNQPPRCLLARWKCEPDEKQRPRFFQMADGCGKTPHSLQFITHCIGRLSVCRFVGMSTHRYVAHWYVGYNYRMLARATFFWYETHTHGSYKGVRYSQRHFPHHIKYKKSILDLKMIKKGGVHYRSIRNDHHLRRSCRCPRLRHRGSSYRNNVGKNER